jgi:hypothetical protein
VKNENNEIGIFPSIEDNKHIIIHPAQKRAKNIGDSITRASRSLKDKKIKKKKLQT